MDGLRNAVVAGAPDEADAARRLDRIAGAANHAGLTIEDSPEVAVVAAVCCQRAPYLATLLARDPGRLLRVAADPYLHREKPAEVLRAELAEVLSDCDGDDPDDLKTRLRGYRADEMVRLGVRELELGNPLEVGHELAHLADAAFDAALAFHGARLSRRHGPPRYTDDDGVERDAELVVIGMGKLGGDELNFCSDVDVIYLYSSDNGAAGDLSLHEYFSKLCKEVTIALGEVTDDDVVFRVDLRLRPEGSSGPIANSLPSAERYYESFGRPWERQAWLKARPCAGSMALGDEVMDTLRPFIYPRSVSPTVVDEVAELDRRIKAELDSAGIESGFDLKNGVGGIREVEFFVQALQLIHGGHRRTVRSRSTLPALDQLLFAGIVTESEHRALTEAYRFLRHAEHVLQLDSGRQTQRLPAEPALLELTARRLGYEGSDAFLAELREHTGAVAELFATLGADEGPPPAVVALAAGTLAAEREQAVLAELGFRDPARSHQVLEAARRKPLSPFGPAATGAAARVAPAFLAEVSTSPDPDQALAHVSDLIGRRGAWSGIWRLLDENPSLIRLIASLLGTSEYLAKQFVSHPELIDSLLQSGSASSRLDMAELEASLDERLAGVSADDEETRWNRLAEFKNSQVLRIGLADVSGELSCDEVSEELSKLAEACLARAYSFVREAMVERHGVARAPGGAEARLSVLALGKLGGRELGYASDLDLVFVYSGDGASDGPRPLDNVVYMSRVAQRIMSGLHAMHPGGRLYEIDTRLRPSGSAGLLVSSLAGWMKYHSGDARLWERQALIKLRPVAGDPALGARVATVAADYVYGSAPGENGAPDADTIAAEITSMRDRIERELASRTEYDLKSGRGGLIDIEFASQYLQLLYGHAHPRLRTRSTVEALRAAADLALADPDDCALLIDGYRFLRTIEHRMRIVHDRSVHRLPTEPDELDKLARRAGYPDGPSLTETYLRWTQDVRDAYRRLIERSSCRS